MTHESNELELKLVLQPIKDHDRKFLVDIMHHLRQGSGESWAVGEMLRRAIAYYDGSLDGLTVADMSMQYECAPYTDAELFHASCLATKESSCEEEESSCS